MYKNIILVFKKINYIQHYLDDNDSIRNISSKIGISKKSFRQWIRNYTNIRLETFTMKGIKGYPKESKL